MAPKITNIAEYKLARMRRRDPGMWNLAQQIAIRNEMQRRKASGEAKTWGEAYDQSVIALFGRVPGPRDSG